jgi:hypothetical protein
MEIEVVTAAIMRLEAQGKQVSVRAIHAQTGGSFRDIAAHLRTLRLDADDQPSAPDHPQGTNTRSRAMAPPTARHRHGTDALPGSAAPSTHFEFPEIRHRKQRAFLTAYSETGVMTDAAVIAGCDRRSHYHWLRTDPVYAAAFERAKDLAADVIEGEVRRRAIEGVEEGVWYQGKRVGTERRYSDRLLELMIRAKKPQEYKPQQSVEHGLSPAMQALYDEWQRLRDHPEEGNAMQPALEASYADWAPAYMPRLDEEGPGDVGPYDEVTDDNYDKRLALGEESLPPSAT